MSSVTQHGLRKRIKNVPIYAINLGQGEGDPAYDATTANGISPSWQMSPGDGVTADIMVPYDWIPGKDIKFWFVYAPTAVGGAGYIIWGIDYVLYPEDRYSGGIGLNPARTVRHNTPEFASFGVVMNHTQTPVCIPGGDLEGMRQIQIQFIMPTPVGMDQDGRDTYLLKVIMEYESYEP